MSGLSFWLRFALFKLVSGNIKLREADYTYGHLSISPGRTYAEKLLHAELEVPKHIPRYL